MQIDLYQEYIYLIGRLKDHYKLEADVNHKDIHTFYKDKKPLLKLMYGQHSGDEVYSIVVSFHISVKTQDAIQWFLNMSHIYPQIKITEVFMDDDRGETYLGEDAETIQNLIFQRECLDKWLNQHTPEEMKDFVKSKIVGRTKDYKKTFDSRQEAEKARIEFDLMQKPIHEDEVH